MKQLLAGFVLALLLGPVWGLAQTGSQPANIRGYVLDSACAFTKNLKKPISPECAVACASRRFCYDSDFPPVMKTKRTL
jgi:hypothetical protein